MSGHIRKAKFNGRGIIKQCRYLFTANNKNARKDFPDYATHGALNDYYLADEASHTRLIQFPK